MNTCPLTLALDVEENGSTPLGDGYLHVVVVTRGAISVTCGPTAVVPAGSLFACASPWSITSRAEASRWQVLGFHPSVVNDGWNGVPTERLADAAAMDYWLIEPLLPPPFLRLEPSPEGLAVLVRSLDGARKAVVEKASPFWRCFARGHLFDLLHGLRRSLEAGPVEPDPPAAHPTPWVVGRLLFLHTELSRGPTLAQAARQAGLNRDAFTKRIRAETGQTFHEVLTDLRLRKAEWLVRQTRLPMARIAEEVGLKDQTHFTRLFKAHYAATPTAYRLALAGRKAEIS